MENLKWYVFSGARRCHAIADGGNKAVCGAERDDWIRSHESRVKCVECSLKVGLMEARRRAENASLLARNEEEILLSLEAEEEEYVPAVPIPCVLCDDGEGIGGVCPACLERYRDPHEALRKVA